MKRTILILAVGVMALANTGCGSLGSRAVNEMSRSWCGTSGKLGVYPGVRADTVIVFTAPLRTLDREPFAMMAVPFFAADLPLSAVADTCLLPHDLKTLNN
jgi:uncharacterized protein YceK